ncbi:MAG: DNA methyltransferase, partial [Nitrospirota bacterium]
RSLVSSDALTTIADFILWYAKDKDQIKIRKIFKSGSNQELISHYEDAKGHIYTKTEGEKVLQENPNANLKPFMSDNLIRAFNPEFEFEFQGKKYRGQYRTNPEGMKNLAAANRLFVSGKQLRYKFFLSDYPVSTLNTIWDDVIGATDKVYVVQTNVKVIERCILMTTDPGDLVFDPTCGSGTTAYVAEQWGRRWITCDTSRVALTLARQRLMTAVYPYYKLADEEMGVKGGFIYEEVPHITLKSIANNEPSDKEILFDKPEVDRKRIRVAGPFTVEGIPQHSILDFEDANYETETAVIARDEVPKQSRFGAVSAISRREIPRYARNDTIRVEAENHIHTLIELFRKDGVTFPGNKKMKFENLIPVHIGFIHAEGEPVEKNGVKKVAVSFGPPHGPVTVRQVQDGIHDAYLSGYDAIIFCGFAFDAAAQDVRHPKIKVFYSHIRPDVLMGDLLKTTAASQLFTVFGEPDIEIKKHKDEYEVILRGVDIYDPLTGEVYSDNGSKIAAWFIDTDYDKRTFCVSQAFFPDSTAWDKLKRALKASIDEEKFELLTSSRSLPFKLGKENRIAVKVIDHRGNEVMVVREMG